MTRCFGAIFLAFLIIAGQFSDKPTPSTGKSSGEPQAKTNNSPEGTNPNKTSTPPFMSAVAQNNPPNTQTKTPDIANKEDQKATTDWWLVAFTGILTFAAALQFFAILRQVLTTRSLAVRLLRAYVLPTLAEITRLDSQGRPFLVKIEASPDVEISTGDLGPGTKLELGGAHRYRANRPFFHHFGHARSLRIWKGHVQECFRQGAAHCIPHIFHKRSVPKRAFCKLHRRQLGRLNQEQLSANIKHVSFRIPNLFVFRSRMRISN
jgi:hypothetical protein